ncbi:hypothetical protein [Negativibacillus massiliensis]|uniref:hypothetical protein n=1 Tax=Negativibacillus massiliensis TaxID=1871035 RepID=UPI003AF6FD66
MPAQWTGEVVGKMHLYGIKVCEFAEYLGYHPKYVSSILSGKKSPKHAELIFTAALDRMIAEKTKQS